MISNNDIGNGLDIVVPQNNVVVVSLLLVATNPNNHNGDDTWSTLQVSRSLQWERDTDWLLDRATIEEVDVVSATCCIDLAAS